MKETSAKIKLLKNYLLLKPYGGEERQTKNGIVIPSSMERQRADKGIVLVTSEKEKENFKVGMKVAFLRFGPMEIEIDDDKFLVCDSRDIVAIIN